ncbi:MAG TPA: hypothetical protein P5533_02695 [Candidatus Cloacimonadota bacterium]|nr:hypothetical protein [Candidatus Cloacimonadota bacterium]
MKITTKVCIFLPFLFLLTACVPRYYLPVPGDGISREDQYAVMRTDSLLVAVRPQAYPGAGNDFANRFFSLKVLVRNSGSLVKQINPNNLSILAKGRQYDYIPLQYVLANLQTSYLLEGGNVMEDPFAPQLLPNDQVRQQEYALELTGEYFSFGDILPGGRKEGYLFYDKKIGSSATFSVDILGRRVDFILSK